MSLVKAMTRERSAVINYSYISLKEKPTNSRFSSNGGSSRLPVLLVAFSVMATTLFSSLPMSESSGYTSRHCPVSALEVAIDRKTFGL